MPSRSPVQDFVSNGSPATSPQPPSAGIPACDAVTSANSTGLCTPGCVAEFEVCTRRVSCQKCRKNIDRGDHSRLAPAGCVPFCTLPGSNATDGRTPAQEGGVSAGVGTSTQLIVAAALSALAVLLLVVVGMVGWRRRRRRRRWHDASSQLSATSHADVALSSHGAMGAAAFSEAADVDKCKEPTAVDSAAAAVPAVAAAAAARTTRRRPLPRARSSRRALERSLRR